MVVPFILGKSKMIKISPRKRYNASSEGWVEYRENTCVLNIDPQIAKFYRALLPKSYDIRPPKYPSHITIVRKFETPNENFKEKWYDGYYFKFYYGGPVKYNGVYYYLDCQSPGITKLRKELGLPAYRFDDNRSYHITIGNTKKNDKEPIDNSSSP